MKKIRILGRVAAFFGRISIAISAALSYHTQKDAVDVATAKKIDQWIKNKGWAEDLNQEEVARIMNLSSEQLGHYFRTRTGQSFLRWRRQLRIEEAQRLLLADRKMPAALVGEAVGISDKSNFRRQFKELTGCTPAEWRQSEH